MKPIGQAGLPPFIVQNSPAVDGRQCDGRALGEVPVLEQQSIYYSLLIAGGYGLYEADQLNFAGFVSQNHDQKYYRIRYHWLWATPAQLALAILDRSRHA